MRTFVAALKVEPSRENRDAVWAGVSAALGGGGESGGSEGGGGASPKPSTAPPPPTAAPGIGLGAKVAGVLAVLGAGAALLYATRAPTPPSVATAPSASVVVVAPVASSAEPVVAVAPSIAPPPAPPHPVAVRTSATVSGEPPAKPEPLAKSGPLAKPEPPAKPSASVAPPASVTAADRLREETDGVRRARKSLREGDTRAALAELDGLDRKFPAGLLEEEREVLRVEALFAAKDPSASRRAERFLLERPQSVHVARIKALLGR